MTAKSNEDQNIYKNFVVRFLDIEAYNLVLSTVKALANRELSKGNKINLSDALTIIIKEWSRYNDK